MEHNLQFIQHGAHRVAVLCGNSFATGTPLVFLHGIAGSVHFWPALLPPSVRDHRRWYSVGLPGHFPGEVSKPNGSNDEISAEAFAELLATVIRKISPTQPVALIGYSTGGFAALNLAARSPELVAAVLCVSGFAVGKWRGILGRLQSLAARGRAGRRMCAIFWKLLACNSSVFRRSLLLSAKRPNVSSSEAGSLLSRVAYDAKQQRAAVLASLFASIRRIDIRLLLRGIRVPVLIAGGNCDPIIPYQQTYALASMIPSAELVTFRGVGHLFFAECPDLFQEMLEDWVERQCGLRDLRQAA